jgi:hypothetical protein
MEWIKFGWGSDFNPNFNKHSNFHVDLRNIIYNNKPLLEVSSRVINEITKKYPPPYYLMVSGGMDSQLMIWCWLRANVDFIPVSVRYTGASDFKDVLNEHDLVELNTFAENNNISVQYKDFDVIHFLENDLESYAMKYQCTSPQICTYMAMSEMIQTGTVFFSGNFARELGYTYTILGLKRYTDISKRNFIPFFLLHDPELAGVHVPLAVKPTDYGIDKFKSYSSLGVPVVLQSKKQTGFEAIKDYYDTRKDLTVPPNIRLKYASMPSKRKFDLLFRYMLMEKIKYIDKVSYVMPNQQ